MGIIKTSIGIRKTIKNVTRLKEIATVFAKNGFDEFVYSGGITNLLPNFVVPSSKIKIKDEIDDEEERKWPGIVGHRLRLCFEELGPTFIKLGQLLGSREDIFDPAFIAEMHKLRDKVKGIDFEEAKELIERSIEGDIDKVFKSIDPIPVGTASIGVVYKAVLHTGEDVVVKVRRPGIRKIVETDTAVLNLIINQIERVSEEVRRLGVSRIVNDFTVSIRTELNFNIEALNCARYRQVVDECGGEDLFYIPKIYNEYSGQDVLVMEFLRGIPFSDNVEISKIRDELRPKIIEGLNVFIKTFLKKGFFHADLHGGNFFYLENEKIGLIDFGLMGSLGKKSRMNFVAIVYSLLTYNFENLVYEFLDVADYDKVPDVDLLISNVKESLGPYIGLSIQETDYSEVLKLIIKDLNSHEIFLPREWIIVFRALITLDGVGKSIGIDLDLFKMLEGDIKQIIKESINKEDMIEEGIWSARNALSSARMVPRHLKWFVKEWSRKNYAFEVINTGYEKQFKSINSSIVFLGLSILSGILIMSGVNVIGDTSNINWRSIPVISWVFWGLGAALAAKGFKDLK